MTGRMGDATTGNVGALLAAGPWDVVAPYLTGAGIAWTPAQRALFAGIPQATIDQAGLGSPVPSAVVRDFEQGAWTASQANEQIGAGLWNPARPTIYCDQANLPGIVADGWRRDLWVAIIGWEPGDAWPAVVQQAIEAGCTVVAVQNAQNINGTYDESVVLDPTWPEASMSNFDFITGADGAVYLLNGGRMSHIPNPSDVTAIQNGTPVSAACQAQLLADFPPGNPTVTVGNVTFPPFTITGQAVPQ
jgi:hypothetical protein